MSSHRKEKVKLSEHGVVTGEAMIAYLQNELSVEDRQELEKLLQQDPFALDAMEGLQSAPDKTKLESSLLAVSRRVRERSGAKDKKRFQLHWTTYAWAAVITGLIIGIGFVLVNTVGQKNTNIAMNTKKPAEEPTPQIIAAPGSEAAKTVDSAQLNVSSGTYSVIVSDSAVKGTSLNFTANGATQATSGAVKNTPVPTVTPTVSGSVQGNAALATTPSGAISKLQGANNEVSANLSNAKQPGAVQKDEKQTALVKSVTATQPPVNARFKAVDSAVAASGYKSAANSATLDGAMQSFYNGDYKTASAGFDNILKVEPDNPQALYFGGISDYINGQIAKSEAGFDKILKKGTVFVDGAKWYKANILLKKGDREHAKTLLQDLSNSNGSYKERAVKLLADLGY